MNSWKRRLSVVALACTCARAGYGAELSAASYVTEGLIGLYDGVENAGYGSHNGKATTWKDLAGTVGDFTVYGDVAYFTADSLRRTGDRTRDGKWNCSAGNGTYRDDVRTIEVAASDIPTSDWATFFVGIKVTGWGTDAPQTITVSDSKFAGKRAVFIDARHYGLQFAERPSQATLTALYSSATVASGFYQNGVVPTGTSASNYWGGDNDVGFYLGSRPHREGGTKNYSTHALRLYNRTLTDAEIRYNHAVDAVRFFGADPDQFGYRLTTAGVVERVIAGRAMSGGTTVPAEETSATEVWAADGTAGTASFTAVPARGYVFDHWEGAVEAITVGSATTPTITVASAGLPVVLQAAFRLSGEIPAASGYVQNGLIGHWDAFENAGVGQHAVSLRPTVWKDLAGVAGDFTLTKNGRFDGDALTKIANGRLAVLAGQRSDVRTIEAVASDISSGSWAVYVFAGAGQHITTRDSGSIRQQFCDIQSTGFETSEKPSQVTFAVTYATSSQAVEAYQNGVVPSGSVYKNWWTTYGVKDTTLGARVGDSSDAPTRFRLHAVRFYNRVLTGAELAANANYDCRRFFSKGMTDYVWTGAAGTSAWADVGNWQLADGSIPTSAPSAGSRVAITNDTANPLTITLAADVGELDALTLGGPGGISFSGSSTLTAREFEVATGTALNMADETVVAAFVATVDGTAVARGIYTGNGTGGTIWSRLTGMGVVRVAGSATRGIPSILPTQTADGWYEFGEVNGFYGDVGGKAALVAAHPVWDDYVFPANAKLRLSGYVFLESVPAGVFTAYDTTQLACVVLKDETAFADGTALTVPTGCDYVALPGRWTSDGVTNWLVGSAREVAHTGDLVLNGRVRAQGIGPSPDRVEFVGTVAGTGSVLLGGARQMRFSGPSFGLTGNVDLQASANALLVQSPAVSAELGTVTLYDSMWGVNEENGRSSSALMFGPKSGQFASVDELVVNRMIGKANDVRNKAGERWRTGGHVIVWGGNTVHIRALSTSLNVVGSIKDQSATYGWFGQNELNQYRLDCFGVGNFRVDTVQSDVTGLFLSTNVDVTVGTVAGSTCFDYTYQSNAVNDRVLAFTGACAAATVKATDLAMLPARLSGFQGHVVLTETGTKSYILPLDVSAGPTGWLQQGRL